MNILRRHETFCEEVKPFSRCIFGDTNDEKNFVNSKITISADVNSINTHIEARDNHLVAVSGFLVHGIYGRTSVDQS